VRAVLGVGLVPGERAYSYGRALVSAVLGFSSLREVTGLLRREGGDMGPAAALFTDDPELPVL
jgi:hypothetical protein